MIAYKQIELISKILASLFSYGIEKEYSLSVIQKLICDSNFVNDLEKGKYSFSVDESFIIKDVYGISEEQNNIHVESIYFADVYINLFFKYKKSFEYLFLYLPLEKLFKLFPTYHEMDITKMWEYFEEQINAETLLRKLSKKKQIKLTQISVISGIDINTLKHYSMSDTQLFNASYKNIYKLARLFDVKENIFLESLQVFYDPFITQVNLNNGLFIKRIGLFLLEYYVNSIRDENFSYDIVNDVFYSKKNKTYLDVVSSVIKDNLNFLNTVLLENKEKSYVVIFDFVDNKEHSFYEYNDLLQLKFKDVFIINKGMITSLRHKLSKKISIIIEEALVTRAKSEINYSDY